MMKYIFLSLFITVTTLAHSQDLSKSQDLPYHIINNDKSFYYLESDTYPVGDLSLPIGVFDSGIGGLTVLDAIVNFDGFKNDTSLPGADGNKDFIKEKFIYLADQANMPYGNYSAENKQGLLREHIIKDVQFLLGNKYYPNGEASQFNFDKSPVKVIVIACNTATAYGKETIEDFLRRPDLILKLLG